MKQIGCEHETGVIHALHSGKWTTELRLHSAGCPNCSQALHLAEAMREEARRAEAHCNPPDPYWILQRSRRMAREIAVRRVARLLTTVRVLAAIYVVASAGWFFRGYAEHQYREVASAMHGASSGLELIGVIVAAGCVAAGLWPILREGSDLG